MDRSGIDHWWRNDRLPAFEGATLPHGAGRSYGDCCVTPEGPVLLTRRLDRFIRFDDGSGVLWCESGVTLDAILDLVLPRGWMLPVVPGTRFISVGGAIANDVHGKNHHWAGTFGCHVRRFELARSDGSRRICSPTENADWFAATIGGLGLTGLVTWAELALERSAGDALNVETIAFDTLERFVELSDALERDGTYSASWVDLFSWKDGRVRGLFSHATRAEGMGHAPGGPRTLSIPSGLPNALAIPGAMRLYNRLHYAREKRAGKRRVPLAQFHFPLDGVLHWNRLYGARGFVQLQCVFPSRDGVAGLRELLDLAANAEQPCNLAVIKRFGARRSPGRLSFPMPGTTVALDFANRGEDTVALLRRGHAIALAHGGRIYPAKDHCMTAETFKRGYPDWPEVERLRDPAVQSSFWRRTAEA